MSNRPAHYATRHREDLTARQREILSMIADGRTNGEIAAALGMSLDGAKYHVSEILGKLNVDTREEAARAWQEHQRFGARLRRSLRAVTQFRLPAPLVAGLAVAAVGGLGVVAVLLALGGDDASPSAAPSVEASPTSPAQPLSPCDPSNLVAGFIVIAGGEAAPDCAGAVEPIPPDAKRYELAVPPGPYNQEVDEGPDLEGWTYTRMDTSDVAFAVYRVPSTGMRGRIVRGENPQVVDFMPGDAVRVERGEMVGLWWIEEPGVTYGFEFSPAATGLTVEQVASLLWFFEGSSGRYWDVEVRDFRVANRPAWLYPEDTTTGIPNVDAAIAAYVGDTSLVPLAETALAPCVVDPGPAISSPPSCPDGAVEGTLVPAYFGVGCPGEVFPLDASIDPGWSGLEGIGGWLYAVSRVSFPEFTGLTHAAIFTTGERVYTLVLTETGVAGLGGGGGCPMPELVPYARTVDSWVLPPLYPLPPGGP